MMIALEEPGSHQNTYQLCGPQVYSLKELVTLIAHTLGIRRWVIGLPDSLSRLQAAVLDFWPGKPFSTDNYRSLGVHSLCEEDGFAALGLSPRPLEIILPQYLRGGGKQRRLSLFRRDAGR
jgi:NADH dehydrogenase